MRQAVDSWDQHNENAYDSDDKKELCSECGQEAVIFRYSKVNHNQLIPSRLTTIPPRHQRQHLQILKHIPINTISQSDHQQVDDHYDDADVEK